MAPDRDPADERFRHYCETGDPGALGEVFDRTAGPLLRVAVWLAGNRVDAEDLLQRTFLKAIELRARFRRGAPVQPWLMGLLGNEARRLRRERDRANASRPTPDRVVDPEATVIANELAATVRSIGQRLGEPYRDVLRLHLEAGLDCNEISRRLRRPSGTVRTQLVRALEQLRRRLPAGAALGASVALSAGAAPATVRSTVVAAARDAAPATTSAGAAVGLLLGANLMKYVIPSTIVLLGLVAGTLLLIQPDADEPPASPRANAAAAAPSPAPSDGGVLASVREPVAAADLDPVALPALPLLGSPRDEAPAIVLAGDERRVDTWQVGAPDGAEATPHVALVHVDRSTPWRQVTELLDELRGRGATAVQFGCVTPDGAAGCFTLALARSDDAGPLLTARLHHEHAGVPPSSIVAVLRRLVRGRDDIVGALDDEERWPKVLTLGLDAPADASFGRVLSYIAAAARAGVRCVLPRAAEVADERDDIEADALLAVDVGPGPRIVFGAHPEPTAPTGVVDDVVGCPIAPVAATPQTRRGGAGGRFGQRGARRRLASKRADDAAPDPTDAAIDAAFDWLASAQLPDGSFCDDHGVPDVEATALVTLALLADAASMRDERRGGVLAGSVGWLMEQQRDDGALAAPGPDRVRRHALATHALAETFGLELLPEVRGALVDANAWLVAQRRDDGGFACDPSATRSDVAAAAVVALALSTCEFFAVRPPDEYEDVKSRAVGRWLADHANAARGPQEAAALFARVFTESAPARGPERDETVARLVRELDTTDPWALMWTSHVVYQLGREQWITLRDRLADVVRGQLAVGELAGSWPPSAGCSRATTTALDVIALMTPSRYARMLR